MELIVRGSVGPAQSQIEVAKPVRVFDDLSSGGSVTLAARLDFRDRLRQRHKIRRRLLGHDALCLERDDVTAFAGNDRLDMRRPSIERLALFRFVFVFVVPSDQLRR